MKKIAVISMGVKLNGEKGYSRFRYIGVFLYDAGYQVDLITTTFQHWEKAQRDVEAISKEEYRKNSITNIIKKTAESLGILFDRNVYCKAYGYITGRTTYLIINRESSTTSRRRRRPKRVEMEGPQRVRGRGEDIV